MEHIRIHQVILAMITDLGVLSPTLHHVGEITTTLGGLTNSHLCLMLCSYSVCTFVCSHFLICTSYRHLWY